MDLVFNLKDYRFPVSQTFQTASVFSHFCESLMRKSSDDIVILQQLVVRFVRLVSYFEV